MNAQPARSYLGIGEVLAQLRAEFPDISVSKIRFLESEGLIEPARSPSGYRRFGTADVERLRYILTAQRDQYLPLRVIKERLMPADRGAQAGRGAAAAPPAGPQPDDRPAMLSRRELAEAAGIEDSQLAELEAFGLIRRVGRQYGPDALQVARTVAALAGYGVQARHLRAVRAAAERETSLIEQVVAPTLRQRNPEARQQAGQTAREIAALSLRLHRALIEAALAEAGLPGAGLPAPLLGADWSAARADQPGFGIAGPGFPADRAGGAPGRTVSSAGPAPSADPAAARPGYGRLRPDSGCTLTKGMPLSRVQSTGSAAGALRDGAAVRQMEVVGVRVEMPTNQPIVLLKETQGERYLPIWIGPMEATAIAYAQQGLVPARPLTHDLLRDVLQALDVQLKTVNITELRDGIFFADLIFSNGKEVSARPSDSIALALRTGATIFASDEILDEAGIAIPDEQEDEVEKFREFLDTITPEDFGRST